MDKPIPTSNLRASKSGREEFGARVRRPISIVLDSLKSAHNVGTILRLGDALMVRHVYICGDTIVPPNYKLKTASRGAEKWVPWSYEKDVVAVIDKLKRSGTFVISAEISERSRPYTELESPDVPVALVLGREYDGVSSSVLEKSDFVAELPIYGMANSINVSVAGGVLLYFLNNLLPSSLDSMVANCPPS